ncbi:BspA family leucine-rich repeat surface protein [Flavobacteriaceae bacterium]|nr:BspA family leucine-rich repeat surface protein [Flavobacteriaceae bacterium]
MKKLLYIFLGLSLMFGCSDDDGNPCEYQSTIITLNASDITDFSATLNGTLNVESTNCDSPNNTEQGFVYSTNIQPTVNDNIVNVNGIDISASLDNLEPETTYYYRSFLTNALGEFYGNEISFETTEDPNPVYLDENGITIKAKDWAEVGMTGEINELIYTIVDRSMLDAMIDIDGNTEQDLTLLCTSKITDMSYALFSPNTSSTFNQNISSWDVSNVTNMENMFMGADEFNQPIGDWNVSNVTNMNSMFVPSGLVTYNFNQDLNAWDVSSVTDMSYMFAGTAYFNQDLSSWDVSNVTNMQGMFQNAPSFNQPIGNWNVSNVTNMKLMFGLNNSQMGASNFNQPIGDWDVSNVIDMHKMFYESDAFNQDISSWNVINVTDMSWMFSGPFNKDLSIWDVSNVADMSFMFFGANYFNQPIENWNVSNVTNMQGMFLNASSFNQDIGNWDVSNVTNMADMFAAASSFNQPIGDWDVSSVTDMTRMFVDSSTINTSSFNQSLNEWNVSNVNLCFYFCGNTTNWSLPKPNFTNCSDDIGCN